MGRIFVAGASGYTGQAVVRRACALGLEVVAHIRPESSRREALVPLFEAQGARVDSTPWEEAKLSAALQGHAPVAVLSLLGTTQKRSLAARRRGAPPETYETVDSGLTCLLLRAAERSGHQPRFVYLSSEGAQGAGRSPYMRARKVCETALAASSLPWVSARPCFITGPDREEFRPLERLGALVLDGLLEAPALLGASQLRDRYRSITAERLAIALVSLALDEDIRCRTVSSGELQQRARSSS